MTMATGAYIGALTDTFGYITTNNVSSYFSITNGQYHFAFSGNSLSATNLNVNSSTATTTLTAISNISELIISYSYVTEQNYDRFTLSVGGITVLSGVSGSNQGTWSGSLSPGQSIVMSYSKDSSASVSGESVTVSLQIPTGSSIRSRKMSKLYMSTANLAKNIKRGYIGINGIARLFYKKMTANLTQANLGLKLTDAYGYGSVSACSAFDEAGFFGIYNLDTSVTSPILWPNYTTVQTINASATMSVTRVNTLDFPNSAWSYSSACAASNNRMFFVNRTFPDEIYTFNSSHTYTKVGSTNSGSISQYRHLGFSDFISGVIRYDYDYDSFVINDSGTKVEFDAKTQWNMRNYTDYRGVILGDKLIVIDGDGGPDVIAVDQKLTVTKLPDTQVGDSNVVTASVGATDRHAIVCFRNNSDWGNGVCDDAYDTAYTHTILPQLISAQSDPGIACNANGNCVFAGGVGRNWTSTVCWYDTNLVSHDGLSAVSDQYNSIACAGDYVHTSLGSRNASHDYGPTVDIYSFKFS